MSQLISKSGIAVAAACAFAMSANAQISFNSAVDYSVSTGPHQTATGDWNGDGHMDLAVTTSGPDRVHLLFNAGDGTFPTSDDVTLANGSSPHGIFAADLDGDQDTDLVVTLENLDMVQVLTNQGGVFVVGATYPVGSAPRYVVAAQLDADASFDLAVSNRAGNSIAVLLNDGSGLFGTALYYAAGNGPRALVAADLDQDGDRDIAVASHDTQELLLLLNNGSGIFTAGPSLAIGSIKPEGVDSSDLDHDGDNDLVSGGETGGQNSTSIFLQTSPGVFSGPTNFATNGIDPGVVVTADFDLDTDVDVAIVNETSNDLAILANNGDATFAAATNYATGTQPDHVIAADLDQNGSIDLVTTNETGDSVSVYINQDRSAFNDLGHGLGGIDGLPVLAGVGTLKPNTSAALIVTNGAPNATAFLIIGATRFDASFAGGTFVPSADFVIPVLLDGSGDLFTQGTWPSGIPADDDFYFQVWILDSAGPRHFSATNGLLATAQ